MWGPTAAKRTAEVPTWRLGNPVRWLLAVVSSLTLVAAWPAVAEQRGDPTFPTATAPDIGGLGVDARDLAALEAAILQSINVERRRRGLGPLLRDATLADIARRTGEELIGRRRLDHIDRQGRGPSDRIARQHRRLIGLVGENLAAFSGHWPETSQALAEELVRGWMGSPGHRRNILRADYSHSGVGLVMRDRELRCVQLFAAVAAYLSADLPLSLSAGSHWPLGFVEGIGEAPEGVSLQPLDNRRHQERRQAPDFVAPADFRFDAPPGDYRLRFYFRQSERRFSVVDGPFLEVTPSGSAATPR